MGKKEKVITATQLLEKRTQLVNRYGEKIIKGPTDNMTPEEKGVTSVFGLIAKYAIKAFFCSIGSSNTFGFIKILVILI